MRDAACQEGLFVALDIGTSGVKANLFAADGSCHGRCRMPLSLRSPHPGWSELDLEQVWDTVLDSTRRVLGSPETRARVLGIGLSVTSPTVVVAGPDGMPLSNGPTYVDARARPRLERIREKMGEEGYRRLTGNGLQLALCSAATMLHLVDEARSSGHRPSRVGHLNSFIVSHLTGRWTMDWTNASYTGLVDLRSPNEWSTEACEALEFPVELLPDLVAPWQPIGRLSVEAATELGLDPSVVVVAGAADTACAAYAVGCVEAGKAFESCGTSGVLTTCHSRPPSNPLFMNRSHVLPDRWLSHGAMSAVGAAVRWLEEEVFDGVADLSGDDYEWVNAEARRSEPGAGGVVFLPYLLGERTPVWDPEARAAWVGMSATTQRHHLIRAVLESAGYGMRQLLEIEEDCNGRSISEILVVGGGARSRLWTSVKADITGRRYLRTEEVEAASRGAAMLAAVGARVHEDPWAAQAAIGVPEAEPIEPSADPDVRELYEERYRVFVELYPALRRVFDARREHARREGSLGSPTGSNVGGDDREVLLTRNASTAGDVAMGGLGGRA